MLLKSIKIGSIRSVLLQCAYFVLIIILVLSSFSLQAMDKEQEEMARTPLTTPQQIHIVSPEAVDILRKLQLISLMHRKISQPTPQIDSDSDFKIAKEHLNLSKRYEGILYAAAISGAKRELVEESQKVLMNLQIYINSLQKASRSKFSSEEDQKELETDSYEVDYRIGRNHLMLLIATVTTSSSTNNLKEVKTHLEEIKRIKKGLSGNPIYYKKLQQEIDKTQDLIPSLKVLFHPEMNSKSQYPSRKSLKKIEKQRQINFYQKVSNNVFPNIPKDELKKGFDPYFHLTVNTIFIEELSLSSKKMPSEEYIQRLQKLTEDYFALEKEGMQFKKSLFNSIPPSDPDNLGAEELKDLYQFFCQRYTLPQKNPLQLLEHIIFMLIHANKLEEALVRTETLKTLLIEKGPLSDHFISFRASVLALNGNSNEWRMLLEEKKRAAEKQKADAHQQTVDRIKKDLEKKKEEQDKAAKEQEKSEPKKETHANLIKNGTKEKDTLVNSSIYSLSPSFENLKSEIVIPDKKVKTRKPDQVTVSKDKAKASGNDLEAKSIATSPQPSKDYPLSKNAFKTYKKIREGNSKFSRMDLYNLFEKLGCKVDISQGKGDHGRIFPPLNMIITNHEGLVGVIPEFIQKELVAETLWPLTVPNWDEKWDGRVPPYMMKSILKALDYLGATNETVHK